MINFDINFWTTLIINFLISSGIFIISYTFFYIQNKNKKFLSFLKKQKWFYYIWLIFISLSLTATTLISQITFFKGNNVFLISNIFIFSITFTPLIGFISIPIIFLINLSFYFSHVISLFSLLNTILLLSLFLIIIFASWILIYKNNLLIFIYSLLISISMNFNLLFNIDIISNTALGLIIYNSSIFVYILLIYSIAKPFTRFIINAKNINDRTYMENNFILNKYFNNFFKNFRNKNNLQYSLLFIIQFDFLEAIANKFGASIANKLKLKILNQIRELFSKDETLYFITKKNQHAFLLKCDHIDNLNNSIRGNKLINRMNDDPLKKYENYFKLLPSKLVVDNITYDINLKINTAIYGVQSNNVHELIDNCSKYHNQSDNKNILYLYDSNHIQIDYINETKNEILTKLDWFSPNDIDIKYYNFKINNTNYVSYKPIIINKLIFNWNDIILINNSREINDAIISHISAKALKQYKNVDKIMIYYDSYSISNRNFDVNNFIKRVTNFYDVKDFCLNIYYSEMADNDYFVENIKKFIDRNIKIFIEKKDDVIINLFKTKSLKIKMFDQKIDTKNNFFPKYEIINY